MSAVYPNSPESPEPDAGLFYRESVLFAFTSAVLDLTGLGYSLDDLAAIARETVNPTEPEPYTGPDPFAPATPRKAA